MRTLTVEKELRYLKVLFFFFGFLIMSWLPRFPEVKANLGLTNGEFGSLISTTVVGSLIALLMVGQLVHNFGAQLVMRIAAFSLAVSLILLTSTHSSVIFLISNIIQAAGISAFHISINAQGFSYQDRTKRHVVTLLSGVWSSGALATAIVSGLLVDRISLAMHIIFLTVISLGVLLFFISAISTNLVKPNRDTNTEYSMRNIFKDFQIDRMVSGALFCALFLEICVGDWAAIFVKEDIGIKSGLHTLPYILFTFTIIIGRLTAHRLFTKFSMEYLVKVASLTSGLSFFIGIMVTLFIGTDHKILSLTVVSISFAIAGLGSSFLAPSVMTAANARSSSPSSVVIGQIGVVNIIAVFFMRLIIAWIAQTFSLSTALLAPALLLLMVPFFLKIFKRA
jgi:fucose permease